MVLPISLVMVGFGILLLSLVMTQLAPLPALLPGLLVTIIGVLILWAFFSTSCEITPADLLVRFGPLRWRIPLDAIAQIVPKRGFSPDWAWGLAWSLDRLVIKYHRRNGRLAFLGVAVSPQDQEGFLRDLMQAVQGLESPGDQAEQVPVE